MMTDNINPPKIKHRVRGSGGGRGVLWLLLVVIILTVGGGYIGFIVWTPMFSQIHDIIGLDDEDLHHDSRSAKTPQAPVNFNQ